MKDWKEQFHELWWKSRSEFDYVDPSAVEDFIQSLLDEQKKQMLEKLELWSAYHLSEEKASMLLSDVVTELNNLK